MRELNEKTTAKFDTSPLIVNQLEEEVLGKHTLLYLNFDDQPELALTESEVQILRKFLERGFAIDAGIKAEFIGANRGHSFANWEADKISPHLRKFSREVFRPLSREHDILLLFVIAHGMTAGGHQRFTAKSGREPSFRTSC